MTAELRNYLRRCANPLFACFAAMVFVSRAFPAALARVWPAGRHAFQERDIKNLRRRLLSYHEAVAIRQPPPQAVPSCSLSLAIGSVEVAGDPDWSAEFPDDEVTISLHRWNWLLRGLTDSPALMSREQGLLLMRSWIAHCHERPEFAADAYSTGERIANGSLFLLLTGAEGIPPDIASAFRGMGREVAANLEYHRAGLTGNHAFNNARALLFAGLAANLAGAADLAFAIAKERLPKLVTRDGFMREGSSHYHFLFTRWVLEMLWLAERAQHTAFVQMLTPYAQRLVQQCWFFLVRSEAGCRWQIPLVGDVSPDFPPDWLISVPWSSLACDVYRPGELPEAPGQRGWSALFGSIDGHGDKPPMDAVAHFPHSGWLRVDHQPWTVFVRAESDVGGIQVGHSHHDLGSFVLFQAGTPLLIDCGRLDYTGSPLSIYGKATDAHNTLLVDDLGATCDGPSWLSGRYRAVRVAVEVERRGDDLMVTIGHDGFARLAGGPLSHRRRLELDRTGLRIEDRLDGTGRRRVQVRFHFAPGIELHSDSQHGWKLGNAPLRFVPALLPVVNIQTGRAQPPFGGLSFPVYGCQLSSNTLDLAGTVNLPTAVTHALLREI